MSAPFDVKNGFEASQREGAAASPFAEYVPQGVLDYLQSICRAPWVFERVLERVDRKVCRRICSSSIEAKRARWVKRWQPEEQERTRALLRRARDMELHQIHLEHVADHEALDAPPDGCAPNKLGHLVIDDVETLKPSLGSGAYLEGTPPQLLEWVYGYQCDRLSAGLQVGLGLLQSRKLGVWDLTAGSGTALDLLGGVRRCTVIATDLTVVASGVAPGDCRDVGGLLLHRGTRGALGSRPEAVVRRPDLILFDPPSRGTPTHADLYASGPQEATALKGADLSTLTRDAYLGVVAAVIIRATEFLSEGGIVSYLARCGSRKHGEVSADRKMLDDLRALLSGHVAITHEMPLVYGTVGSQVSLGKVRVPATHLVIERLA